MSSRESRVSPSGRRAGLALAVLVVPVLVLSMDVSVLLLALPSVTRDLDPGPTQQLWIADIYGFMLAGFLVTIGTLGDRIGHRRLLIFGAGSFAVLSAVAAFSQTSWTLIAARALLGIAGAMVMPSALATVTHLFPVPRQRESAIALIFGAFLVGGTLGPVVGGVLLHFFWWGSVFLVAVPVMLLLVALGPRLLPESSDPEPGRLDPISVALALAGVLGFVGGLKLLTSDGRLPLGLITTAVGIAVLVLFVVRQLRLDVPLIDLSVFRIGPARTCLIVSVLGGVVLGGTFLVITQFLQLVHGLDPLRAGLWMMVPTGAMAVGTFLGPAIAARTRPVAVMAGGTLLGALGLAGLLLVSADGGELLLVTALGVALFGFGLPGGIGINIIVGSVPPEKAGAASGLSSTGQEIGLALGLAVLGTTAVSVYRDQLDPTGVPSSALAQARTGMPAALATGDPQVIAAAKDAFTAGLHVVVGVSSAVVLALAVLIAITLRRLPAAASNDPQSSPDTTRKEHDMHAVLTTGPVIPVSDLARSITFYEEGLGLTGQDAPGGYRLDCGSDAAIFLLTDTDYPGQAGWPLVSIETSDIDALVGDLDSRGVTTSKDVPYNVDERGISTQDGMRIAWYTDPDRQVISIFQRT